MKTRAQFPRRNRPRAAISATFTSKAGEGIRTLDMQLGKLPLCQLSYARNRVFSLVFYGFSLFLSVTLLLIFQKRLDRSLYSFSDRLPIPRLYPASPQPSSKIFGSDRL